MSRPRGWGWFDGAWVYAVFLDLFERGRDKELQANATASFPGYHSLVFNELFLNSSG